MRKLLARLGLERREARAWALYDFANSAVYTTIITAVFPIYFARVAASELDSTTAEGRYGLATTIALSCVAVMAPVLGALADYRAAKKRLLLTFALLGMVATAGLFLVEEGDWLLALVLFGLVNFGAAASVTFYDALLPHVAGEEEMDRLSMAGYALGYLGGGVLLGLNIAWIQKPEWFGLPEGTLPTRLAFLSVAVWWLIFTIPLMRRVPEPPCRLEPDERPGMPFLKVAFERLFETFRELRRYKQALLMLAAFLIYNDGILTVIRMASLYAAGKNLDSTVVIGTILAVQFIGVPFAFLFGQLAGRFGAKRMVFCALAVYCGITVLAYFMTTGAHFVALGVLVAMVQGGSQGLSRSLFASMVPKHKSAEFFALFGVGEKFAGILGPLVFSVITIATGSSDTAILSVLAFFVVGAALLWRVDADAGRRAAQAADAETRRVAP
jgi:UMF1 family MFS transporter